MDCSPPGSSVHGIIPARILEWVAIFSSRVSTQGSNLLLLWLLPYQADSLLLSHWGSQLYLHKHMKKSFVKSGNRNPGWGGFREAVENGVVVCSATSASPRGPRGGAPGWGLVPRCLRVVEKDHSAHASLCKS